MISQSPNTSNAAWISPSNGRRAAFLVSPHPGGTFTVFTAMRQALAPLGITLEWINVSNDPNLIAAHGLGYKVMDQGHFVLTQEQDEAKLCQMLVSAIANGGFEIVFVNVLTTLMEMSVAAYLPASIRRVMIAHNITPGTYEAAKAVAPYVNLCVGVSPRIEQDLKRLIPRSRVACVPNAMDFSAYEVLERPPRPAGSTFRLLSAGRIVDVDKGVFWLPKIMERLSDLPVHLTIAGHGVDQEALKARCAKLGDRITFAGMVPPGQIPSLMAENDVLIMPSRFEGFGYTLIEAMAAGCVPVASRMSGVTAFIVDHERTGLLFPIGDIAKAAEGIRRLIKDPALRQRVADAGRQEARSRFPIRTMTEAYRPLLGALDESQPLSPPLEGEPVELLAMGGGWRKFVPHRIKNYLRAKLFS